MFKLLIVYALVAIQSQGSVCNNLNEDAWIEPHDWSHLSDTSLSGLQSPNEDEICNKCSFATDRKSNDETAALIYFKRFISILFNQNELKFDEKNAVFRRSLMFTILPAQLEELTQLQDPRDLNILLEKIYENVQPLRMNDDGFYSIKGTGIVSLIWDVLKDLVKLLKNSEMQFTLFVIGAITIGWFVHRRYRIRVVVVVLGGIFLFGYFTTYFECNRKLEAEQFIDGIETVENSGSLAILPWYTRFANFLTYSNPISEIQKAKIRKSSRLNLAFCRPDHVLLMYFNDLFMKQLEFLLEKCSTTLTSLKNGLSFPYNYIASMVLLFMIGYILKLTFKYILSPRAWASLLHGPTKSHVYQQKQITSGVSEIIEDRISGDNLRMLLNVVANNTTAQNIQERLAVSGVQEVLEQLEAAPKASSKSSSKSSSPNTSIEEVCTNTIPTLSENNNSATQRGMLDASKVSIEDCVDDID